ncbi:hypothetical protein [Laspinema olomoucense]|uniref:Uncharacterized protein n=1 Tax=Laspinema olomoucense D3b TaxID=2953688 RepID=A0ABT2NDK6_9CYAN|nr:hypothetical protein [Laspinema sp. D3b]MCT7979964.1 hypothetical protein [Laspinema sp. D3b]
MFNERRSQSFFFWDYRCSRAYILNNSTLKLLWRGPTYDGYEYDNDGDRSF